MRNKNKDYSKSKVIKNHANKAQKMLLSIALAASVITPNLVVNTPEAEAALFGGGQGTEANPYIISTPQELNMIRDSPTAYYELANDIDITGMSWVTIPVFSGTLDGKNHKIIGVNVGGTLQYLGFIGQIKGTSSVKSKVKNLRFVNLKVVNGSKTHTGGLAGSTSYAEVSNVSVEGEVISQGSHIGGLLGLINSKTDVLDCYTKGKVEGSDIVGGLVGQMANNSTVRSSFSTSDVSAKTGPVGGAIGQSQYEVTDVYSTGNVTGTEKVGGVVGISSSSALMKNLYSTGKVKGNKWVGGIIGLQNLATLSNVYALNSNITGTDPTTTGKAIGSRVGGSSSSINSMTGYRGGHTTDITGDVSPQDLMKKATYQSGGFEFEGGFVTPVWGIDEGTTLPYLLNNPQRMEYSALDDAWFDPDSTPVPPAVPIMEIDNNLPTKGPVKLTITYPGEPDIKEYKIGTDSWKTYSAPISISANTNVQARSANGSVYSEIANITISNIDNTPPVPATFTVSNTLPTNQNVNVTINYPTDAAVKQYKLNSEGVWKTYTSSIELSNNDIVYARSTDAVGNISSESQVAVTNINKQTLTTPTFSPDSITPTNQNVSVGITYPSEAYTREYRVNGGMWTTYTSPVVFSTNGKLEARATDIYGNISPIGMYDVSNIDTSAPDLATLKANITTPTNGDVTVTITYPADVTKKEYKIGSSGSWTLYTSPVVISANDTVYARSTNAAGSTSNESSLIISNIDKIPPSAAVIVPSETLPTNQDVTVNITYPDDAVTRQYRIDDGAWTTYTTPLTFNKNSKIEAQSFDAAGNNSTISSYTITNINKATPVIVLSEGSSAAKEQTVTVSVTGITPSIKKYAKGYQDKSYFSSYGTTISGNSFNVSDNGIYTVFVTDAAGNSATKEIEVKNVDKTPPVIDVKNITEGSLYTKQVTPVIKVTDENDSSYIATLNGDEYTGTPISVGGDYTLKVDAKDVANNTSSKTINFKLNLSPKLISSAEEQTLRKAEVKELDLSNYFSDPENDSLTYVIVSSEPSVVVANQTGSKLKLEAMEDGHSTVSVTAKDANSSSETLSFRVIVSTTLNDLVDAGITGINPDLEAEYQEALDGYVKPPTLQDIQDIVNLVNQADRTRLDLTKADLTKLDSMVLKLKTSETKDKYSLVYRAYSSMYSYENDLSLTKFNTMQTSVGMVTTLSKLYMNKMTASFSELTQALKSPSEETIMSAESQISLLDEGILKGRLYSYLEAISYVEQAKANTTEESINLAKEQVSALPSGQIKDELNKVLEGLADSIKPAIVGEVQVLYLDEEGFEISEKAQITGTVGSPYTTIPKLVEGYTLYRIVGNEDSVFGVNKTTVKYIYKKEVKPEPVVYGEVHVTYVDAEGIELKDKKIINNKVGSYYITEAPSIEGYRYVNVTGPVSGNVKAETTEVVYHYVKVTPEPDVIGEVYIKYVDENGAEIKPTKVLRDKVGTLYTSEAPYIANYTFNNVLGDEVGKIKDGVSTIIYSYTKDLVVPPVVTSEVHISYVDEDMAEIKPKKVLQKVVGDNYSYEPTVIEGYDYQKVLGSQSGVVDSSQINIVYIYKKQVATLEGEVNVTYIDEDQKEIKTPKVMRGPVGSVYSTEAPYIPGYTLFTVSGSQVGKIDVGTTSVVYHYKKDPEPPKVEYGEVVISYVDSNMQELKPSKTVKKEMGESYQTEPVAINGYEYVSVTGYETGIISSPKTNVVYMYKKVELPQPGIGEVEISYVDENGNSIKPKKIIEDKVGTVYVTEGPYIKGYTLEAIRGYEVGKILEDLSKVVYTYKKTVSAEDETVGEVHVSYVDESLKNLRNKEVIKTKMGEPYSTEPAEISGYKFERVAGAESGVLSSYQTNVLYIYEKGEPEEAPVSQISVSYIDTEGNTVKPKKTISGKVGEPYVTEPVVISGYKYVSSSNNASGVVTEENIDVVYVYEKEAEPIVLGEVTIMYLDKDLNPLKAEKIIKGEVGTKYNTEPPFIKGYNYVGVSGYEEGNFDTSKTTVVYHYEKNDIPNVTVMGEVHISYVDENGNEIKSTKFIRDKVGETYSSKASSIEGYELIDVEGNQTGVISEDLIKVTYKYKKTKAEVSIGEVEVLYLDDKGQSIFTTLNIKDKVGTDYTTKLLPISGYEFVNVVGNTAGKITDNKTTVTYNYKKIDPDTSLGQVEVRYVDETNKDLKERLIIKDKVGAPYATAKVDIPGYDFVSSTGVLIGQVKAGTSYVLYMYKKSDPNKDQNKELSITVSYLDNQGKELAPKTVTKGKKGEYYNTKPLSLIGYTLESTVGLSSGVLEASNVEVKYIYKKNATLLPLPTNPGDKVGMGKTETATLVFEVDKKEVVPGEEITVKYKVQSLLPLSNSKLGIYASQRDQINTGVKELGVINLTNNSNQLYEGYIKVKLDSEGEFNLTGLFTNANDSRNTIETNSVVVKVKAKEPAIDLNKILPELKGFKTAIMQTYDDTDLYQMDSSGKLNKVAKVAGSTVLGVYDTYKDYYKLSNGLYVGKNMGTVYVGQGEARNSNVKVYDESGKSVSTIKKGDGYKVYSYSATKYNIGEGKYVKSTDFNAYIFGWIKLSKDMILYDRMGKETKTLKSGETYRVFAVDKDTLNLGGGYTVKKQDEHYKFIAR